MNHRPLIVAAIVVSLAGAIGCSDETADSVTKLTSEQLTDPQACKDCHPKHYREWSGSMHAYAADDPVFIAMNKRGKRETKGELGDFCIKCHAPMAVKLGATTDGLNVDELPRHLKGVTCIYCHSVTNIKDDHNAAIDISVDAILRGGLAKPLATGAHKMEYSALHDGGHLDSSKMCGTCHDIVTPRGLHIERTFKEWRDSLFSSEQLGKSSSCSSCHMHTDFGKAANVSGAEIRKVHAHDFPGVDLAVTEFPERATQRKHVQEDLDPTVLAQLCVEVTATTQTRVEVFLQNVSAGHSFPSGASADRRLWVELIASKGDKTIWSSGVVKDDEAVADKGPSVWLLRDTLRDKKYKEVHMFWEAEKTDSQLLPAPPKDTKTGPEAAETRKYRTYVLPSKPDSLKMRLRLRPIGLDVLNSLVKSGDLDPKHVKSHPTFDLAGGALNWTAAGAKEKTTPTGRKALCVPKLLVEGADDPLAGADPYTPGMSLKTKNGQVTVRLEKSDPAPPAEGKNTWTVKLHDPNGKALDGLSIEAGTWMPDHHHGSPIIGKSKALGGGRYEISPIELFMPGLWEITLGVSGKATSGIAIDDKVVFRFWVAE